MSRPIQEQKAVCFHLESLSEYSLRYYNPVESPNKEHLLPQHHLRKVYSFKCCGSTIIHLAHYMRGKLIPVRFYIVKLGDYHSGLIGHVVIIHLGCMSVHGKCIDSKFVRIQKYENYIY